MKHSLDLIINAALFKKQRMGLRGLGQGSAFIKTALTEGPR